MPDIMPHKRHTALLIADFHAGHRGGLLRRPRLIDRRT